MATTGFRSVSVSMMLQHIHSPYIKLYTLMYMHTHTHNTHTHTTHTHTHTTHTHTHTHNTHTHTHTTHTHTHTHTHTCIPACTPAHQNTLLRDYPMLHVTLASKSYVFTFIPCIQEFIASVVSPELYQRYTTLNLQQFVSEYRGVKWCPHPGCDQAVATPEQQSAERRKENAGLNVWCGKGHAFCWYPSLLQFSYFSNNVCLFY